MPDGSPVSELGLKPEGVILTVASGVYVLHGTT